MEVAVNVVGRGVVSGAVDVAVAEVELPLVSVLRTWLPVSALLGAAKAVSATRRAALTRKAIPVVLIMSFITSGLASACCSVLLPTRNQSGYQMAIHLTLSIHEVNKHFVQDAV